MIDPKEKLYLAFKEFYMRDSIFVRNYYSVLFNLGIQLLDRLQCEEEADKLLAKIRSIEALIKPSFANLMEAENWLYYTYFRNEYFLGKHGYKVTDDYLRGQLQEIANEINHLIDSHIELIRFSTTQQIRV